MYCLLEFVILLEIYSKKKKKTEISLPRQITIAAPLESTVPHKCVPVLSINIPFSVNYCTNFQLKKLENYALGYVPASPHFSGYALNC